MKKETKLIIFFVVAILFLLSSNSFFGVIANNDSNGGFVLDGLNFEVVQQSGWFNEGTGQKDNNGGDDVLEGTSKKVLEGNNEGVNGKDFKKSELSDIISRKIESLQNSGLKDVTLIDLDGNGIFEIIGFEEKEQNYHIYEGKNAKSENKITQRIRVYKFNGTAFINSTIIDGIYDAGEGERGCEVLNFKKKNKDNYFIFSLDRKQCDNGGNFEKETFNRCLDGKATKLFENIINKKHEHSFDSK